MLSKSVLQFRSMCLASSTERLQLLRETNTGQLQFYSTAKYIGAAIAYLMLYWLDAPAGNIPLALC